MIFLKSYEKDIHLLDLDKNLKLHKFNIRLPIISNVSHVSKNVEVNYYVVVDVFYDES
jgi:hypothetical protein